MPLAARRCPCHNEPMYWHPSINHHECYRQIKARWKRSNDAQRRTPHGRRSHVRSTTRANACRLLVHERYYGLAKSPEQAQVIRAHIRKRCAEYRSQLTQEF